LPIYRFPRGNFTNFLNQLDLIWQKPYNSKYNIVMSGDVNVKCLNDNNRKSELDPVLHSSNLAGIVKFPTGIGLNSHTTTDSVFIDTSTIGKYDLYPFIKVLSDHNTQLLISNKVQKQEKEYHTYFKRKTNKYTIADFRLKLSHETWDSMGIMLIRFSALF